MTLVLVTVGIVLVLAIGFFVSRNSAANPERAVRSWEADRIERFHVIAGAPEHLIYVQVVAEPNPAQRTRLVEALERPGKHDLRSSQDRVVQDAVIAAVATWATGLSPSETQSAGSSESLTAACEGAADAVGLSIDVLEILAVVPLDAGLRNLNQWFVNAAYYDRGDDKEHTDHINAAVVQLDAGGAAQIMVRSRPERGAARYRRSTEVVDNSALTVEVLPSSGGFRGTQYRSFDEIRRSDGRTEN